MTQNNNTANQVPDQRLEQIMQTVRRLENENQQLKGHLNVLTGAVQQKKEPPKDIPSFTPEVKTALDHLLETEVKSKIQEMEERFKYQLGAQHDRIDELLFKQKYGGERYEKLLPKVQERFEALKAQGNWVPREEILKHLYFEDTGHKPSPDPIKPKEPTFDPYFGKYVDPQTGMPIKEEESLPEIKEEPVQQTNNQQINPQIAQALAQLLGQNQNFNLPGGAPPNGVPQQGSPGGHINLDIDASVEALDQWEKKYGDQAL